MMSSVSSCFRSCPAVADDTVIEGRCSGNALRVNFPAGTLAYGRRLRYQGSLSPAGRADQKKKVPPPIMFHHGCNDCSDM